jgi:hypothetical protein
MIIVKPKIIGDFIAQDMARMVNDDADMAQVMDDVFIRLKTKGVISDKGASSGLEILQGEMKIKDWFAGFQEIVNYILDGCGLSPQSDSTAIKTTSEVYAQQKTSAETLGLLRQLRADQLTRIHDNVLIIEKL